MSLLDLLETQNVSAGEGPLRAEPSGFVDNLSANFTATRDNYNSDSEARLKGQRWGKALETYSEITGQDPFAELESEIKKQQQKNLGLSPRDLAGTEGETNHQIEQRVISEHFQRLREQDPERFAGLKTFSEIEAEARAEAQDSLRAQQEVYQHAEGSLAKLGSFVGGFAGAMTDPINVVSMAFGAGAGRSILKTAAIEAGVNVGAEVAIQPQVMEWQKEIGNEYGLGDVMQNLVFAAGGGAVLGGGMRAVSVGAPKVRPKANEVFAQIGAKIADMENIPRQVKSAVKYFERISHIKEADPIIKLDGVKGIASRQHEASLNVAATRIFSEEMPLRDIDLGITAKEFNSINTKKTKDMTPEQVSRLEEIEKFQNEDSVRNVRADEDVSDIDLDAERVRAKEASREAMTDDNLERVNAADFRDVAAVDKINKDGTYSMRVDGETVKAPVRPLGMIEPGQAALVRKTKDGYEAYPLTRDTFSPRADEDNLLPEDNPLNQALSVREEPGDLSAEMQFYKNAGNKEYQDAMMADYNRMLEENPDMIIYDADGNSKTLREFMEDLDADERSLTAMQTCSVGG